MRLSDFLRTNRITLTEFATRIGSTTATVSRIADGLVVPRRKLLVRIFEATGGQVTPNDLTGIHPPNAGRIETADEQAIEEKPDDFRTT